MLKIPGAREQNIRIDLINYLKIERQVSSIEIGQFLNEFLFWKRPAFCHEKEVRVLFSDDIYKNQFIILLRRDKKVFQNYKIISEAMSKVPEKVDNGIVSADIDRLDDYILGVRVNPLAEKRTVELVKTLCSQNNIKFFGQSDLYDIVN